MAHLSTDHIPFFTFLYYSYVWNFMHIMQISRLSLSFTSYQGPISIHCALLKFVVLSRFLIWFHDFNRWVWINSYENTIFNGMNIHKSQLYFDVNRRGTIGFDTLPNVLIKNSSPLWNHINIPWQISQTHRHRVHASWMYMAKLAAAKEFAYMKALKADLGDLGSQRRHGVLLGLIHMDFVIVSPQRINISVYHCLSLYAWGSVYYIYIL